MKVFALHDYDQAPTVTEAPLPEPLEGEVRVRVRAASLNGFDLSVANGYLKGAMEHHFPVVLGKDFAGDIDALGAGVENFAVGDRVFGVVTKPALGDGSIGEYVTVPVAVGIVALPESIGFTEAAALGLAGTAAVDAVDAAQIQQGSTVLIVGATGGVGQQAVQLAARLGTEVIATASSDEEIALVTGLGAAYTVDYQADVAEQIAARYPDGVDVVLHFAGDPLAVVPAAKQGGVFVSTMLRGPQDVPVEGVRVVSIYAAPSAKTLARVASHQDEQHTTVIVQHVYELENAADAFRDFAAGTLGKLVISIA